MDGQGETLEQRYNRLHAAMSQAQATYLADKTPKNWAAFLAADEAYRPTMVAMSQRRMQAQIDRMGDDEFASFRRMIN